MLGFAKLSREGARELAALQPPVNPEAFPQTETGTYVFLPSSGRRLGYCEHIDMSVPADQLRNVVLLPGIPGSRLFTHPTVQQRGCVPSWRLIVLERPGIGLSDPPPEPYTYTDFVADFREFCAVLGLRRITIIGFSAGTPFATALACVAPRPPPRPPPPPGAALPLSASTSTDGSAASSASAAAATAADAAAEGNAAGDGAAAAGGDGSARTVAGSATAVAGSGAPAAPAAAVRSAAFSGAADVTASEDAHEVEVAGVALVSTIGPPDTPNKGRGMALMFRFAYWACAHAPWLVGRLVRSEAAAFRRRPLHALRRSFSPFSGKADMAALKRPEVERLFLESALELYGRGQEDAVLRENLLFASRPWDFDLAACRTRVAVWQGVQDRGCTVAMATYLAERMGSMATVKVVLEHGHMLYFDVWGEVVDWVNGLERAH